MMATTMCNDDGIADIDDICDAGDGDELMMGLRCERQASLAGARRRAAAAAAAAAGAAAEEQEGTGVGAAPGSASE